MAPAAQHLTSAPRANNATTRTTPKVYFENLNSIRFIAATLVIIHHIEQFKYLLGFPSRWGSQVLFIIGKLGVILFFVLSGFLISYLLFKEQEFTKTISVKDFYIRRILRIWPLYFLIIGLAFFVLPFSDFFILPEHPRSEIWSGLFYKLALYVFFLPNLAISLFTIVPYASQAWSIGAEEQFYLIWPWLNKFVKNKWLLMLAVIAAYLLVKFGVYHVLPHGKALEVFSDFWHNTPIDCMAIGGLFAVMLNDYAAPAALLRRIVFSKPLQWATLLLTIGFIAKGIDFGTFHYEIYALLFGVLIVNFAANPNRIFSMEFSWISYLGKVSYGMYMYHAIAIVGSIRLLHYCGLLSDYVLYPLALLLTVGLSAASYHFFEQRFIVLKDKYAKIISGDSAKTPA